MQNLHDFMPADLRRHQIASAESTRSMSPADMSLSVQIAPAKKTATGCRAAGEGRATPGTEADNERKTVEGSGFERGNPGHDAALGR
jgi:hypothetical protein